MSLFENKLHRPLSERIRPTKLSEVWGQTQLTAAGQLLPSVIKSKKPVSMIFWGPPGSGKTTLARLIAAACDCYFVELSAVSAGLPQVREVIEEAKNQSSLGKQTLLFIDEIHRFNKAQQDAFLPHVENGTIILLGATTENPSFEVIRPLLSRVRVVTLEPIDQAGLAKILTSALKQLNHDRKMTKKPALRLAPKAKATLLDFAAGDARIAINGLEAASALTESGTVGVEHIQQALQQKTLSYDKQQDDHYNHISAFIKSMRGSATNAALFYLQRMLEAGEDPKFIARRIVIFASEDIGMAHPHALTLAVSAFQAVERLGMPEAAYTLTQATIAMSTAKKSRVVANALYSSRQAVHDHPGAQVPLHIRNAPTKLMDDLGYAKGYKWEADFQHKKGFLPEGLEELNFYTPDQQHETTK